MSDTNDQFENGVEIAVTTVLSKVPYIGEFISALIEIFWPNNQPDIWSQVKDKVEQLVDQKIAAAQYAQVQAMIGDPSQGSGLIGVLADYVGSVAQTNGNGQNPKATWTAAHTYFIGQSAAFQQQGIEVLLLPLYAQMANLHLALLKDGVSHKFCNDTELTMYLSIYENYAGKWATQAINDAKARTGATWTSINQVTRFMQINVLNYLTLWPYFDPIKYPPPITADIRSTVEIFYTYKEAVANMQWPYSKTNFGSVLPATPQSSISELTIYCDWNTNDGYCLLVASQVAYANGVSTPYSGFLSNNGQPLHNLPQGRPTSNPQGYYDLFYTHPVPVTATNPITSVQGVYESTDGIYCIDFGFKDGTSTGNVPNQAGMNQEYPNKVSIIPPTGYMLSSLYTPPGGWYYSAGDVVVGFRMRY